MNIFSMLGDLFPVPGGDYAYLSHIVEFLNQALIPLTITLGAAAGVFSVVIGFMIMKAESSERSNEMKKRMWHLILTFICVVGAVWLLAFVLSNLETIMAPFRH